MADPIRCVYSLDGGYFCTKHSNAFYDASCRLLEGKPCEDQKPPKPTTNYDLLIRKSPEELTDVLTDIGVRTLRRHKLPVTEPVIEQAKQDWLDWLKQEASE